MPDVVLPASRNDDLFQVNPYLANEVIFLVLVEDRALELIVVRRFVYSEAKFLIPR